VKLDREQYRMVFAVFLQNSNFSRLRKLPTEDFFHFNNISLDIYLGT